MTSGDRPTSEPTSDPRPATLGLPPAALARFLRDELRRRLGLHRQQVRVKTYPPAYRGEILSVSLLVPGFPLRRIERLVAPHRFEKRCPFTGALEGTANREIHVALEPSASSLFDAPLTARLARLPALGPDVFHVIRIGRYRFEISRDGDRYRRRGRPSERGWSAVPMAQQLARILAQSRQWRRLLALTPSKEP
jgi:hypothetical protein